MTSADLESFRVRGYVIFRGVFTKEEVLELRKRVGLLRTRELEDGRNILREPEYPGVLNILGDLLGKEEFREFDYLTLHPRIVDVAHQLLGGDLVYSGDSAVQIGQGGRGFHKDNVTKYDPAGADWHGDYPLVRIGIYLQDHERYSGGLKVRVGSHLRASHRSGSAVNIPSAAGDIVAWNLRITHSANAVRMKGFPNLCLHPRIERILPPWLRVPEERERMVFFCTYGLAGDHLKRFMEDQAQREDCREFFKRSCVNGELLELARRRGVRFCAPIPDYGSLHPGHDRTISSQPSGGR